jgi:hypothetical protein
MKIVELSAYHLLLESFYIYCIVITLVLASCRRLIVISTCCTSSSHSVSGNAGSGVANVTIVWFLASRMLRSAALAQWLRWMLEQS